MKKSAHSEALVRGKGCFVDDVPLEDCLHVAFVRSEVSAAEIRSVIFPPDVFAGYDGSAVAGLGNLAVNPVIPQVAYLPFPVLAQGSVFAVGQPVAAVLGVSRSAAQAGADQTGVEFEMSPETRLEVARNDWCQGDAPQGFEQADMVVECDIRFARLAPNPMEPRGIAVQYHQDRDSVTIWHSTQTPHRSQSGLADILGISKDRIRVIAPNVGGAFGMKASLYPEEVFTVWAAFRHRRNVKWVASRSEDFLAATHGRGLHSKGRLGLSRRGEILTLEAEIIAPVGHWLPNSALIPAWNGARILPAGYRVSAVDISTRAITENRAPVGIYRGAGRPEANCLMERLMDKAAKALGRDPLEFRIQNLVTDLPRKTATGNILDSGDYAGILRLLAQRADYAGMLAEREKRRAKGEIVGVGLAFYLEPSGSGWETARVLWRDGKVTVQTGSSCQGQGRAESYARIVSQVLKADSVQVIAGDTGVCPTGIGALASRSTAIGGSAVLLACKEISERLQAGETGEVIAEIRYENKGQAWGCGAYLVMVSVEPETGVLAIERAVCVDDAGVIVDAVGAEGQIRGGFAQGLGEALMERVVYDDAGQLLSGSLMDYALPRAGDIPPLRIDKMHSPSPMNALGAKGLGEAGTIGAPAAILNAACDALDRDLDMPLTSEKLWRAMQEKR